MQAKGKKIGRPTKYKENMPELVEQYIKDKSEASEFVSLEGVAVMLNVDKDTIQEWQKDEEKRAFSVSLKKLLAVQAEQLQTFGLRQKWNATMAIFLLKNNHGFKDKTEVDHTTKGKELPTPLLTGVVNVRKDDSA